MTQPLQGMTVLDLSRLLPGPMCSLHLLDMGARVIKVEDTGLGDYTRSMGMPPGMVSPAFHVLNRGKESISVDIRQPQGRAILLDLVKQADVVLESFRPGVLAKLGLSYQQLRDVNPRLVMCSISGYGQTGPWADKAGHDMNYCATAGVLDQCGGAGEAPSLSNFQIADLAGGALSAAMAILAGLVGRLRHNEGCYLDVSMTDCTFANHVIPLATMNLMGNALPRGQDMLTGARPCYSVYATADGKYMAVGALEKKFWTQLCAVVERPEWEARYLDMGKAAEQLRSEVAALFAAQEQAHWRTVFADHDCCVTPILSVADAFQHPQLLAREMVQHIITQQNQRLLCPASPIKWGGEGSSALPGPLHGQHTPHILADLQYSESEIEQWQAQGMIRCADARCSTAV